MKIPKNIKEITQRDNFGTSDVLEYSSMGLTMVSKTFNFVNAADGQADCITTDTNGEDYSWDAVWKSKAIITGMGY
jgi:hypothetical protein